LTYIVGAGSLGLARTSSWNRNGFFTAGMKRSVLNGSERTDGFFTAAFFQTIHASFSVWCGGRTAATGGNVTQKNILLSVPPPYIYRLHKMCLVFTSNLLGYNLQIKILFIHRNNNDKKFVMAYEYTLYSGYAFENSRKLRGVPCSSVCVAEMCCTEGLTHNMPTLKARYSIC